MIKAWFDQDPEGKCVTIIRPTVIFGEKNRGNVYNLLRQIASGKFLMIHKVRTENQWHTWGMLSRSSSIASI